MKNLQSIALMALRGKPFKVYILGYSALIRRIWIKFLEQHLDFIYTQPSKFLVSGSFQLTIN